MNLLENTKPEQSFYCIDGSVLRNLKELEQKLRTIGDTAFRHHVNPAKNDFYNWVRDVFQDQGLASEIAKSKTATGAANAVKKSLEKAYEDKKEIEAAISKARKMVAKKASPLKLKKKKHAKPKKAKKTNRNIIKKQKRKKSQKIGARNKGVAKALMPKIISRKKRRKKQVKSSWVKWLKIVPEL